MLAFILVSSLSPRSRRFRLFAQAVLGAIFVLLILGHAEAAIQIPKKLDHEARVETLKIVGFGTASKILSDPYPLGGFSGLEVGLALENMPTEQLSRLGAGLTTPQQDITYSKFTIGKGLYNNLDLFFQFTPYNRQDELSQFGGIMRWGFYQATFTPASLSLLANINYGNVSNVLTTNSYGIDLVGGFNFDDLAFYAGLGTIQATGTFAGGGTGITDSGNLENEIVAGTHSLIGVNLRISQGFLAVEVDRYTVTVASLKAGARF